MYFEYIVFEYIFVRHKMSFGPLLGMVVAIKKLFCICKE